MRFNKLITQNCYLPLAYKKKNILYKSDINNRYAYELMKVLNTTNRYAYQLVKMLDTTNRYAYYKSYATSAGKHYGKIRSYGNDTTPSGSFPWSVPEELVPINTIIANTAAIGNNKYDTTGSTGDYTYFIIQGGDENV